MVSPWFRVVIPPSRTGEHKLCWLCVKIAIVTGVNCNRHLAGVGDVHLVDRRLGSRTTAMDAMRKVGAVSRVSA